MSQKFFDRLLLFVSVFCLLIILQINFFHIPLNWFNLSQENMEKINTIFSNIASSIIAGYIFYLINIQIISYIRSKQTKQLIKNYLIDIATQMKVGQLYLKKTYFPNKDFDNLESSDFSKLTTLQNLQINFSYKQLSSSEKLMNHSTGTFSEIDLFEEEREVVRRNIQVIFSFPHITLVDYELINLLHKIQSSYFYIGVHRIKNGVKYMNFNEHFFDHYEDFKLLTKYVEPRKTI